jgi:hypothetical protein
MILTRIRIAPLDDRELSRFDQLSMLRGQLSMLRRQREEELPITVESLARAERVARSLEISEAAL